jgi:hypothetical protein
MDRQMLAFRSNIAPAPASAPPPAAVENGIPDLTDIHRTNPVFKGGMLRSPTATLACACANQRNKQTANPKNHIPAAL